MKSHTSLPGAECPVKPATDGSQGTAIDLSKFIYLSEEEILAKLNGGNSALDSVSWPNESQILERLAQDTPGQHTTPAE